MKTNRMKKFTPYFYILPTFIILAVVIVIPIIYVIIQSFYTTFANESVFVGLRNYKMAFEDELLLTALKNNLKLFLCVPILTVLFTCHLHQFYITKSEGGGFTEALFLFRTYWQFRLWALYFHIYCSTTELSILFCGQSGWRIWRWIGWEIRIWHSRVWQ